MVSNAEVMREPSSVLPRPELVSRKFPGHFKSKQLNRLWGCRGTRCRDLQCSGSKNELKLEICFLLNRSTCFPCLRYRFESRVTRSWEMKWQSGGRPVWQEPQQVLFEGELPPAAEAEFRSAMRLARRIRRLNMTGSGVGWRGAMDLLTDDEKRYTTPKVPAYPLRFEQMETTTTAPIQLRELLSVPQSLSFDVLQRSRNLSSGVLRPSKGVQAHGKDQRLMSIWRTQQLL
jgi:hypothetical protein